MKKRRPNTDLIVNLTLILTERKKIINSTYKQYIYCVSTSLNSLLRLLPFSGVVNLPPKNGGQVLVTVLVLVAWRVKG
jgi:hypothetical protein